jgi:hypothetical protein
LSPRSPKPRMAADAAGITTGDGACRRTSPATDTGATTDRHSIEATMGRESIAERDCGLISAAAGTRRGTPAQSGLQNMEQLPAEYTVQDGLCKPYTGR